jgi:hypothetical protein
MPPKQSTEWHIQSEQASQRHHITNVGLSTEASVWAVRLDVGEECMADGADAGRAIGRVVRRDERTACREGRRPSLM